MKNFLTALILAGFTVLFAVGVNIASAAEIVPFAAIGNFFAPDDANGDPQIGAAWDLDDNGILTVQGGLATSHMTDAANWPYHWMPDAADRANVREIIFTAPVTASGSMNWFFAGFPNLERIDLANLNIPSGTTMTGIFSGTALLDGIIFGPNFPALPADSLPWGIWHNDATGVARTSAQLAASAEPGNWTRLGIEQADAVTYGNLPQGNNVDGYPTGAFWLLDTGGLVRIWAGNAASLLTNPWELVDHWMPVAYRASVTEIQFLENVTAQGNMTGFFSSFPNLVSIVDIFRMSTTGVTDMHAMFFMSTSLANIAGIASWQTGNVTNMQHMFWAATSLADLQEIEGWNTNRVTNMQNMFWGASAVSGLDLSRWQVGSVTNMSGMFTNTAALNSLQIST